MPSTSAMLTMMMKIKNRPILILPCVKRRLSVGRTFFWCLLSRVDDAFSETSLAGCCKQHDHPAP
jgi:hypothetical protein